MLTILANFHVVTFLHQSVNFSEISSVVSPYSSPSLARLCHELTELLLVLSKVLKRTHWKGSFYCAKSSIAPLNLQVKEQTPLPDAEPQAWDDIGRSE